LLFGDVTCDHEAAGGLQALAARKDSPFLIDSFACENSGLVGLSEFVELLARLRRSKQGSHLRTSLRKLHLVHYS